ncbi:hypothetical protein [Saccharothrix deserti]|nr:hypothetical protein [Saccharothrix deserti]
MTRGKKPLAAVAVFAVAAVGAPAASAATTITNGGFESGTSGWTFNR